MSKYERVLIAPEPSTPQGDRAERIIYPESPRYRRIRVVSNLMDQSILLPGGYRIGIDPILGLLPGIGDALGALVSCYLVYESARLGVPKRILARMFGNILLEGLVGLIPILGDLFDAVWKANIRNLQLLDAHYNPARPERSAKRMAGWILGVAALFLVGIGLLVVMTGKLILTILSSLALLIRP